LLDSNAVETTSVSTISTYEDARSQILEEHREPAKALLEMGLNLYMINGVCYVNPSEIDNKIPNGSKPFEHWIRAYIKKCKQVHDLDIADKVQIFTKGLPNFEKKTKLVLIKIFQEYYSTSY